MVRLKGILGQERAVSQLEAEMAAGRLAHAYLFAGPAGVGRGTTAKSLFQILNCHQAQEGLPCGSCDNCRRIRSGTHEDFLEVAPDSEAASAQIKVEQVREVIRTLSFPPFAKGTRVVLIRRAGNLNPNAANALLKTLEEPPPNNICVLTVQDAGEILPTLVSRCRRVNFSPLDQGLIGKELISRGLSDTDARLKAAMSGGSLGKALLLDGEKLLEELARFRQGLAGPRDAARDWRLAEDIVKEFRGGARLDRQGLSETLDLWAQFYRDQAVVAAGRPEDALLPRNNLSGLALEPALEGFRRVRVTQSRILANASPELAITVLLGELHET